MTGSTWRRWAWSRASPNGPIHHLSFGQQKRVCLAGVLAMQPQIMLLDEPTAGLDPAGEAQLIELLIQRLNRREEHHAARVGHALR